MRAAQAGGLAFLFAPLTTVAFVNISRENNGDAAALFTMFRNVSGSIGISLSTAMITQRTQIRLAYLSPHLSPLDQGYVATLSGVQKGLTAVGHPPGRTALGTIYQMLRQQASVLAYMDIFAYCAVLAFLVVPLTLFLSNRKGGAGAAA